MVDLSIAMLVITRGYWAMKLWPAHTMLPLNARSRAWVSRALRSEPGNMAILHGDLNGHSWGPRNQLSCVWETPRKSHGIHDLESTIKKNQQQYGATIGRYWRILLQQRLRRSSSGTPLVLDQQQWLPVYCITKLKEQRHTIYKNNEISMHVGMGQNFETGAIDCGHFSQALLFGWWTSDFQGWSWWISIFTILAWTTKI